MTWRRGPGPAEPLPPVVAVIDDHRLLRISLTAALQAEGYVVVAPALTDLGEVAHVLSTTRPSVALLDLDLGPLGRGEELLPVLTGAGTRVLVVSGQEDETVIGRCLQAGAHGTVPKTAGFDELLEAILATLAGQPVMTVHERERLVGAWRRHQSEAAAAMAPFEALTRRESVVLAMLMDGRPVERIAADSFVSVATVRTQVRSVLLKLGVNSQLEAVGKANRAGWSARPEAQV